MDPRVTLDDVRIPQGAQRRRILVRGTVQGVGFRPFVYKLANELRISGWVNNNAQGVCIEAESEPEILDTFITRISCDCPPIAKIRSCDWQLSEPKGLSGFRIVHSDQTGPKTAHVLPDLATCIDCAQEIFNPQDRHYRYPFTNCTNCGPRFSIIERLPYDRANTAMKHFRMCEQCHKEYANPQDRRFHAQPNACPQCGPQLDLWDHHGQRVALRHQALTEACQALLSGAIVAVKGLGGFHLMVLAEDRKAVGKLRERKNREQKPFAVMMPNLQAAQQACDVSVAEQVVLSSPQAPIVLMRKRDSVSSGIVEEVAPGNPFLGLMLPYTPLHHLLMHEITRPVVATSANLSDEPICICEREALKRLQGIADFFLVHDRPIVRHVDDSIVQVVLDESMVLRRARGYAPEPIIVSEHSSVVLAVGAHLKNTIAVTSSNNAYTSQHIGDLETEQAYEAFNRAVEDLPAMYDLAPQVIACDLHEDYVSTRHARASAKTVVPVQHHFAHVVSGMAEHHLQGPVLGISWDGTGLGLDRTIWGGEFMLATPREFSRFAHLRTFMLPGGDAAIREPRPSAIGLLYELMGDQLYTLSGIPTLEAFSRFELSMVLDMLSKELNSTRTSSMGRLFDVVSSLLGISQIMSYEGQAAMHLQFVAEPWQEQTPYSWEIADHKPCIIDWGAMVHELLADVQHGVELPRISQRFHATLVDMIIKVARLADHQQVVLSGGCFQNRILLERAVSGLRQEGFEVFWQQQIPTNDGGIAVGQAVVASALQENEVCA